MKKNESDMMTTKSKSRLSVYNSGVFDELGRETVISCGYTIGGKFGYFICKERVDATNGDNVAVYEYTDQTAFYPKENEKTYPRVLEALGQMLQS